MTQLLRSGLFPVHPNDRLLPRDCFLWQRFASEAFDGRRPPFLQGAELGAARHWIGIDFFRARPNDFAGQDPDCRLMVADTLRKLRRADAASGQIGETPFNDSIFERVKR